MTVKKEIFPTPACRIVRFDAADVIASSPASQDTVVSDTVETDAPEVKSFQVASAPGNQQ